MLDWKDIFFHAFIVYLHILMHDVEKNGIQENMFIFGMTVEEVEDLRKAGYNAADYIAKVRYLFISI